MKKYINLYVISVLFIAAGAAHFSDSDFYLKIIPRYIPFQQFIVDLTGLLEILGGLLILFKKTRKTGVNLLVCLLVLFFIVHIDMLFTYTVSENIILSKFLLFGRILIQILLIIWVKSLIKLFPDK